MKSTLLQSRRLWLAVLVAGLTIGLVSWGRTGQHQKQFRQDFTDTTPKKQNTDKEKKQRDNAAVYYDDNGDLQFDFDAVQEQISKALKSIDGDKIKLEMQKAMENMDLAKIQAELQESLSKLDFEKMKLEMEKALKSVDLAKVQEELKSAFSKANMEEVKAELEKAMKEVDVEKIRNEIKASFDKEEWAKMKAELEEMKNKDFVKMDADLKEMAEELKGLGPQLEKEMAGAREELEKAKAELKEHNKFLDALQAEGLLNKKGDYTIEHANGELTINGKKVPAATYEKLRWYLDQHKKMHIEKSANGHHQFNVD